MPNMNMLFALRSYRCGLQHAGGDDDRGHESQPLGDVRLPKWWRVLYKSGADWKEVENPNGYGFERDKFDIVTFKPVKATALRLDVQSQHEKDRWAMGILEWRIK